LALQSGGWLDQLSHSISRANGAPTSIAGHVIDLLKRELPDRKSRRSLSHRLHFESDLLEKISPILCRDFTVATHSAIAPRPAHRLSWIFGARTWNLRQGEE
jgi:hypothetical protein